MLGKKDACLNDLEGGCNPKNVHPAPAGTTVHLLKPLDHVYTEAVKNQTEAVNMLISSLSDCLCFTRP